MDDEKLDLEEQARREKEQREQDDRRDERWMEQKIRLVLGLVERIMFCACIFAIVVLGERNFWSREMRTAVEPITSIGKRISKLGIIPVIRNPQLSMNLTVFF